METYSRIPLSDRTNYLLRNRKTKKPFILSSSVAAKSLDRDCSESETSIGSSPHPGNGSNDLVEPVYRPKKAQGKTKDKESKSSMPLIIYSEEKTSVKGKSVVTLTRKPKDTLQLVPIPASYISMVNTRNKRKENGDPFSCPSLPKIRKKRVVSKKAENICVSSSYAAPHSDHNKKKSRLMDGGDDSVYALPQEYVEEQLAYFKEIDDFEMAEEVVSENGSDNEDGSMGTLTI